MTIDAINVDGEGFFVPRVAFQTVLVNPPDGTPVVWQRELEKFGHRYQSFIQRCQGILAAQRVWHTATNRAAPLAYWALGDEIVRFLAGEEAGHFHVAGLYHHLVRDLALSSKTIQRVIRLRRVYAEAASIPDNQIWSWLRDTRVKAV